MTTSWRISTRADLALRTWGDEYVVHHALSNDTHRLSAVAGQLLLTLARNADAGINGDDAVAFEDQELRSTLETLSELGLVARC